MTTIKLLNAPSEKTKMERQNDRQMRRTLGGARIEIIHTGNDITLIPTTTGDPDSLQAEIIETGGG